MRGNEYVVRVSIFGRMFEEPTDVYQPSTNSGPTTLAKAWSYKLRWEAEHEGYEPVAEVIHQPTGRVITNPLLDNHIRSLSHRSSDVSVGLSLLRG
jgi:hypothetical protein